MPCLGIIRGSSRRPWTTPRLAPTRCAISSCYCSGLACAKSSGRYCEDRDRSARNISADSAEAGLFQMSWDAHTADAEILRLFGEYRASQDDGLLAIFREGVTAHQYDLESYGSGDG